MRFTVFFMFLALTLAMVFTFGISLEKAYYNQSVEQKVNMVQTQCNILADQIYNSTYLIDQKHEVLNGEIDQLASVFGGRIIVVNQNFKIVRDSYTLEQDKYLISENVIKAMNENKANVNKQLEDYVEVLCTISDNETNTAQGVIVATVSVKDIVETGSFMSEQTAVLQTLFAILAVVISAVLATLLTRNFKTINKKLKYMAGDHIDETLEIQGFTEMRDMAKAINNIVTKMKSLEDSRQEFVSNVSHELKTPLTSMKVLADSLLSQADAPAELYREFMVDIVDEIDRENKIINDLLALVKLDKKATTLNITIVNINELLELLLKRLRPLAARRDIEITFESFRQVSAEIDEVKLSLAISNLIENAIKYNIDSGWIRVSLNADHKFFYVKVQDSGVGIPEDCQEQIFERFYRVDKARSRETGGTGLGLSITRNAILLHKGAIKVYSKEGEGTIFTIRVPLSYVV